MKKIKTLFERDPDNRGLVTAVIAKGLYGFFTEPWVPTEKIDGSAMRLTSEPHGLHPWKRFDAKPGRDVPPGSEPCGELDPETGHWPHWVKCSDLNPADKWYIRAFENAASNAVGERLTCGTYEAIGPHFQGNPYHIDLDIVVRHGNRILLDLPPLGANGATVFAALKGYLTNRAIEGIVWYDGDTPVAKIKARDFGIEWPRKRSQ